MAILMITFVLTVFGFSTRYSGRTDIGF